MKSKTKYQGKYPKCRSCAYVQEALKTMVIVNQDCPHGKTYSCGVRMVDKPWCEQCRDYMQIGKDIVNYP